ncbi:putative conserved plasma membrane protein [Operophtera brumata]|uniref:Putative conserved plasma membrane protein n=1 Tax=Operophtera brumata TaxID=104452 RepID=A0A0L7LKB3_OPEBR|nr:putative conserved plasma membrane protein [Operophtera brumata]
MVGVTHELLGLLLCLVIGFIFGLAVCAVDSQCEYRSLWVGMLIAIPSGAGVALAVLGDYTASLVGGLLWAMSLFRLISPNDMSWRVGQPSELALLGTRSLCLTLINILSIFLAGVKQVRPLERRDITWWRANKNRLQASKKGQNLTAWEIYSKWSNDPTEEKSMDPQTQSDTVTFRRPHVLQRMKAQSLESCLPNGQMDENYQPLYSSETTSESQNSENSSKEPIGLKTQTDHPDFNSLDYNFGSQNKEPEEKLPTLEPSLSFTVDSKRNGIPTFLVG